MATKIDWDNISACSGRDSRFPVIKLGLAGKEKGPFRRINLGNEYEDIVAAMRSRAIELLTADDRNVVSSLESLKVTLKYLDCDGEECIIMSTDEVHDAVAQYEGCSSIKVFATVEIKKPTAAVKNVRVSSRFKALQPMTEVEVSSIIESREDMAESRSRRGGAKGAESREGVDTSSPRAENRRSKKMTTSVPKVAATEAKKNFASHDKHSQSPRQLPFTDNGRSSIHAIHTGNNSSPPRTISTKAVGGYPKKSHKDSSDKSVSSRSSGRRWNPPSIPGDESYESNRSSKSALFLQKAPAKVLHMPSNNSANKVKSLRVQKIDGKNKKLIKIDAAPRSFMVTAPKKINKQSESVTFHTPKEDAVPRTLDIATNNSSSLVSAENGLAKQDATETTTDNAAIIRHGSISPINVSMPPRHSRQVVAKNGIKLHAAKNAYMSSISSSKLQPYQQDRCPPTSPTLSEAATEKIRNAPFGTTATTTKSETKQSTSGISKKKKKNAYNVDDILAMDSSSGRGSGASSLGGGGGHTAREEDGECSSSGSRTSTTSEADTYEGEEATFSTGSSTYNNNNDKEQQISVGSGKKAEAFSLNSILAGFYSFGA